MSDDYHRLVTSAILDAESFISATFSGQQRGHDIPWRKVTVRPVLIRNRRVLQFSYLDERQDTTKNYDGDAARERLDELLVLGFKSISVQTTTETLHVQFSKKGRAIVHHHPAPETHEQPSLRHDRRKNLLLPADRPDPFLQQIGIMTRNGKVRANMQRKFRQVNEFLRLMSETGAFDTNATEYAPLRIVDCGCGSAHLSFAVYHYLQHVLGTPVTLTGVDVNEDLLHKRAKLADALGWESLALVPAQIIDYQPDTPPDIVLALHACDTATDEALAQAVRWGSHMIFSVPCCHHHLQAQLNELPAPPDFAPVWQHGILKHRLGDILTDTFRAQILRLLGYRADVIEFISPEHTDKNLMIRAVHTAAPGDPEAIQDYRALRDLWGVTPYLESLLADHLATLDPDLPTGFSPETPAPTCDL
ncbi:MAG: SAM-dependent methyltransferase [Chloroflexi bacterium]|nr:SAM-dependent methyltransferase [Chloroflexota bacterium]